MGAVRFNVSFAGIAGERVCLNVISFAFLCVAYPAASIYKIGVAFPEKVPRFVGVSVFRIAAVAYCQLYRQFFPPKATAFFGASVDAADDRACAYFWVSGATAAAEQTPRSSAGGVYRVCHLQRCGNSAFLCGELPSLFICLYHWNWRIYSVFVGHDMVGGC